MKGRWRRKLGPRKGALTSARVARAFHASMFTPLSAPEANEPAAPPRQPESPGYPVEPMGDAPEEGDE